MTNQPPPSSSPDDEQVRLDLLEHMLNEGSPLSGAFDLITEAVAIGLNVPIALVSLVGRERQHFVAKGGGGTREMVNGTPLSHSFCRHVVVRQEQLVINESVTDPLVEDNPAIEDLGVAAYAGQPITVHGHVLGSLCAIDNEARQWSEHEVKLLRAFADVVQFLTEARLTTEGQWINTVEVARTRDQQQTARLAVYEALSNEQAQVQALNRRLQHALLPRPTAPAGLAVDVFYRPGSDRLLLGGDFVDTRPVGEDQLDFVLGDVTGHGPEAAALAISLRSSWRALRAVGAELSQVAAVLDEQTTEAALYATLVFGTIASDGRLTLINGGHPPPITIGSGGTPVELHDHPGPMLGLGLDSSVWAPSEHQLDGRTLLAYTDGLIEGRIHQSSERFGIERLLASITELGPEPELLCRAATEANHESLPDDVAILRIDRV
jgi:serine phosphatase RsbU (regulator of sigma subunit)